MPVLLFPLMVLLRDVAIAPRSLLLVLFTIGAHNHQIIRWQRETYLVLGQEIWWIWMPAVLLVVWISRPRLSANTWESQAVHHPAIA